MGEYGVVPGQRVAIIWDSLSPVKTLKDLVDKIQALVGADNCVSVEIVKQLSQLTHKESSFDVILSPMVPGRQHSVEVLAEIAWILKPGGCVLLKELVVTESGNNSRIKIAAKLLTTLTLSGLMEVKEGPSAMFPTDPGSLWDLHAGVEGVSLKGTTASRSYSGPWWLGHSGDSETKWWTPKWFGYSEDSDKIL
ncbi:LOW QUALITY PROTEIN: anamorsin-like [Amazona ochrocephala]